MGVAPRMPGGRLKVYPLQARVANNNATFSINLDAKGIPGYKRLTSENFYIQQVNVNPKNTINVGYITRAYYPDTGILTVSIGGGTSVSLYGTVYAVCVKEE